MSLNFILIVRNTSLSEIYENFFKYNTRENYLIMLSKFVLSCFNFLLFFKFLVKSYTVRIRKDKYQWVQNRLMILKNHTQTHFLKKRIVQSRVICIKEFPFSYAHIHFVKITKYCTCIFCTLILRIRKEIGKKSAKYININKKVYK